MDDLGLIAAVCLLFLAMGLIRTFNSGINVLRVLKKSCLCFLKIICFQRLFSIGLFSIFVTQSLATAAIESRHLESILVRHFLQILSSLIMALLLAAVAIRLHRHIIFGEALANIGSWRRALRMVYFVGVACSIIILVDQSPLLLAASGMPIVSANLIARHMSVIIPFISIVHFILQAFLCLVGPAASFDAGNPLRRSLHYGLRWFIPICGLIIILNLTPVVMKTLFLLIIHLFFPDALSWPYFIFFQVFGMLTLSFLLFMVSELSFAQVYVRLHAFKSTHLR